MELLGTIGSLVSLLAAVLFYFGWASTDAETRALGLRDSIFRLSTSEYLLRSVEALFLPAFLAVGALLAAIGLQRWVTSSPGRAETAVRRMRWGWLPPVALAPFYVLHPALFELVLPLVAIPGLLAAAYALTRPAQPAASDTAQRRLRLNIWALALVLCLLSLFWAVSSYAGIVGRGRAEEAARAVNTPAFPSVVVFSEKDLMIRGGGACYQRVKAENSAYAFRYSGLRLFYVSGDRVYLVDRKWRPSQGTLWVVRESDSVRVEYVSGPLGREPEC
ncbi:hypothetical protein [Streptomyces purpurascens]|uniref:Uncharacterized protein n=1 Tax=Streptomyces purpurascens TaxID=1924 RepID=A0ABZ1MGC6_STREF|nr:hypothetical protein [Streptomyces purpurascens]MCE7051046.1 hypothetical protein [Streptomyces purpurascens]GHA23136.1 hypothetical protein GCM10010303_37150 [Streptomyces purpurascens]